ncbi:putative Agenet-like domain-containing protein [Medicago truncatula]|uniref:Agenet domain protein n=1 Tax=Medicago truncatula TaxID=3880 RepID=G7KCW1_MEDTR|nr:protein AGENET DOMAIN (AGD)-CONTAINING P1-like [Medicago truncatula]AET00182.1 agenet domain protein [Medicago truncatula]RHN57548.1 putative Agenet-like domain-containing protein [Medicago truncatula]
MRPPEKRVDYKVGDKVEVCSEDEGFVGSYFEATIVSCLESGKYVIRYKNLLKDDESELLMETLFPKDLRPIPPHVRNPLKFKLNQKVDVFDNDGWWVGKIASEKILMEKSCYYSVYFDYCHQTIYYPCDQIRVHQELVWGDWIFEA